MSDFEKKLNEIIRVDQAGELGAKVIYQGQIAALKLKKDEKTLKLVEHMLEQEVAHFNYFDEEIKKRRVRPTVMHPIWKAGGFALGFITAMIDKKAAMTCTTAVEEVIDEHYLEQIKVLEKQEETPDASNKEEVRDMKEKIIRFRQEEIEHRDIGYENDAAKLAIFKPLSLFIKATTKFAIAVSKKI